MDIRIRDLSYTYHPDSPFAQQVLQDIDLDIPHGKRIAIIGQTGSGKSTLVQHMNGLLRPTQGSVQVGDVTLTSQKKKHPLLFRNVGLIFQYPEHQLFEETVAQDIAYGPKNLGWTESMVENRVQKALTLVGLDASCLGRSPFELSGGQKRRVAIAGVLAMQPEILILDEPTAGLDPQGKQMLLEMLVAWQQEEKRTLILITHQMDDVAEYADEVIVLAAGKVKWHTDPLTLFTKYADQLGELGLDIPQPIQLVQHLNRKLEPPIILESPKKEDVLRQIARHIHELRGTSP